MNYARSSTQIVNAPENFFGPFVIGLVVTATVLINPLQNRVPVSHPKSVEIVMPPAITEVPQPEAKLAALTEPISVKDAVGQIKLLSDLTHDQIAEIFKVDRRSVHHWLDGKVPSEMNYEKIMRVLSALRYVDRGLGHLNKVLLLTPTNDGKLLKDYLEDDNFEIFLKLAGAGNQRPLLDIESSRKISSNIGKLRLIDMLD